jgi:NAD(P)-dependent dehydrogenase (short-subunit alcohol dehydrogenase family)
MRGLENKVVVVAGGGGIGSATVERLASAGARLVVGDLNGEHADELARRVVEAGGDCVGMQFDITDEASVNALVAAAVQRHGGLDAIHVNAADLQIIKEDSDVLSAPMAVFDRTVQVDLRGHWLCTRAALPRLLQRGGGSLVYTGSAASSIGEPTRAAYACAKAGTGALMRHVASRWGVDHIRANVIAPGFVLTPATQEVMTEEMRMQWVAVTKSWRLGAPRDIASMVAFLISDEGEWINGQVIGVDGGTVMR